MGKCLITKLNGSVDDTSLPILGKIRIEIFDKINDNQLNKNQGYIASNGSKIEWDGEESPSGTDPYQLTLKTPKNGTVYISDKYNVSHLQTKWMYAANVILADLSKYCTNLKALEINNSGQTGDLSEIAELGLTTLGLSHSAVTGNINSLPNRWRLNTLQAEYTNTVFVNLKDLAICINMKSLNFTNNSNVNGDIANLATLTNLETLAVNYTSVSGDLSSLAGLPNFYNFSNWSLNNTWSSSDLRPSSSKIISGAFKFATATDTDNFLINMAKCQASAYKEIYFQQSHRTSASDAAVATLQGMGYTLAQLITD